MDDNKKLLVGGAIVAAIVVYALAKRCSGTYVVNTGGGNASLTTQTYKSVSFKTN